MQQYVALKCISSGVFLPTKFIQSASKIRNSDLKSININDSSNLKFHKNCAGRVQVSMLIRWNLVA